MNRVRTIFMCLVTFLLPQICFADGTSALSGLFSRLQASHRSIGASERDLVATPTIVRGLYAVSYRSGKILGYLNESGSILGDSKGFMLFSKDGAPPRPLSEAEIQEVRAEIASNIEYERLPKIVYGNGGDHRLILFSAIDCPSCRLSEDAMRKFVVAMTKRNRSVDMTIHVIPSSLSEDARSVQIVKNLWCAPDFQEAWLGYFSTGKVPPSTRPCGSEPRDVSSQLTEILSVVGLKRKGVPAVFSEEGKLVLMGEEMRAVLKPETRQPPAQKKVPHWLVASSDQDMPAQINLGGALKTLLGGK